MGWFEVILFLIIVAEILFTVQVYCNFHYAMKKYKRERFFHPQTVLIVPCKGLDSAFEANIRSFYEQAYKGDYRIWFVVEDASDPAHAELERLRGLYAPTSQAAEVEILLAGRTTGCSQKLHNLLFAYRRTTEQVEALVFADSDACAGPDWLGQLVAPLRKAHIGLASGYRWFVPEQNNLASLALSAMNAKVCQLLGNTRFNLAWGGSMAVRRTDFVRLDIERLWSRSLSDDLSLSRAIRRAGMRTRFVPACMIASYESTTWPKLWEFGRRQFIITRIYAPWMWLFGLLGSLTSVAGLWGGLALAIWAAAQRPAFWPAYAAVGGVFLGSQVFRAIVRQELAVRLLPRDREAMRAARRADFFGFWAWGVLLMVVILSSSFGRTITWRGIRYRIAGVSRIEILSTPSQRPD